MRVRRAGLRICLKRRPSANMEASECSNELPAEAAAAGPAESRRGSPDEPRICATATKDEAVHVRFQLRDALEWLDPRLPSSKLRCPPPPPVPDRNARLAQPRRRVLECEGRSGRRLRRGDATHAHS